MDQKRNEYESSRRDLIDRIKASRYFGAGRLLRAFPEMKHRDYPEFIEMIKQEMKID